MFSTASQLVIPKQQPGGMSWIGILILGKPPMSFVHSLRLMTATKGLSQAIPLPQENSPVTAVCPLTGGKSQSGRAGRILTHDFCYRRVATVL